MRKKSLTGLVLALIVLLGIYFFSDDGTKKDSTVTEAVSDVVWNRGELAVHFLNVGQGDSTFIELPNGKTMLIDASEAEYAGCIINYIEDRGHSKIDYVVATHPHSDHIGGMADVIDSFEVGTFYMPEKEHTTEAFENMLTAVDKNGCEAEFIKAGDTISSEDGFAVEVVAPVGDDYEDLNDYSAVIRISHGETAFLFTSDAESISEKEILNKGYNIKADVLKVGHHGSKSSSTKDFINAVSPRYAVISCGEDNEYGFPKEEIVERLKKSGAEIYVTYEEGNIAFVSDGEVVRRAG